MNKIPTAYYEPMDTMSSVKLNPTGRWKIHTSKFSKRPMLYIEHRFFWIFTTWAHEENINFYDEKEVIFDCRANKKDDVEMTDVVKCLR